MIQLGSIGRLIRGIPMSPSASSEIENTLVFEILHKDPIELSDLSDSLYGLAEQYKHFVVSNSSNNDVREARLYVKEVKQGSIIVHLSDLLPVPLLADANVLMQFSLYLFKIYDYFKGKLKDKPEVDKTDLKQCSSILKPIAKDSAAQINVSVNYNGDVQNHYTVNYLESNAIQNGINREIESRNEPGRTVLTKELMYWYQAKNDPTATTGDRVVIETISKRPVKVIFDDDGMKAKILADTHNLFRLAYVVDVEVQTIDGIPSAFKVMRVHESFDRGLPPQKDQ